MLPIFSLGAPWATVLWRIEFSTQTHVAHTSFSPSVFMIPLLSLFFCYSCTRLLLLSFSLSLSFSIYLSLSLSLFFFFSLCSLTPTPNSFFPRSLSLCLFNYPGWPLLFRYSLCLPQFVYFHGSMRLARFTYGRYFLFRNTIAFCHR